MYWKRQNELSDGVIKDALDYTSRLLEQNPDIATFYNFRREILLQIKSDW